MRYAVSRATRGSSLAYAAHAALLARCHESFRAKYLESAKRAWDFAMHSEPSSETFIVKRKRLKILTDVEEVYWRESTALPSASFIKAAINLGALTGEKSYLEALDAKSREIDEDLKKNEWRWGALTFAGERELGIPPQGAKFMAEWERRLR